MYVMCSDSLVALLPKTVDYKVLALSVRISFISERGHFYNAHLNRRNYTKSIRQRQIWSSQRQNVKERANVRKKMSLFSFCLKSHFLCELRSHWLMMWAERSHLLGAGLLLEDLHHIVWHVIIRSVRESRQDLIGIISHCMTSSTMLEDHTV